MTKEPMDTMEDEIAHDIQTEVDSFMKVWNNGDTKAIVKKSKRLQKIFACMTNNAQMLVDAGILKQRRIRYIGNLGKLRMYK